MLKIRLQRVGRKHEPVFRVVVTDSRNSTKSGRFHEILGSFDARGKDFSTLNEERVKHWLSKGVQPTPRLHNLFLDKKLVAGKKVNVLPRKSPIKKDLPAQGEPKAEAAPTTPVAAVAAPVAEAPTSEVGTPTESVVASAEEPKTEETPAPTTKTPAA